MAIRMAAPIRRLIGRRLSKAEDFEPEFLQLYERCRAYSMASIERMYALFKATEYIASSDIPGDFVECGVWRGGSSMMCALTLALNNDTTRRIFLYDTYSGMSEPTEADVRYDGTSALRRWRVSQRKDHNTWAFASLNEVRANMISTGYPEDDLIFVSGRVEETIPETAPDEISLLRLDTDWKESTYHELIHLFPRLSHSGVLLIDDYGHWRGAREAVDQYFNEIGQFPLLNRIDYTGRIAVRTR